MAHYNETTTESTTPSMNNPGWEVVETDSWSDPSSDGTRVRGYRLRCRTCNGIASQRVFVTKEDYEAGTHGANCGCWTPSRALPGASARTQGGSTPLVQRRARGQIAADTAMFLASGGKIREIETEFTFNQKSGKWTSQIIGLSTKEQQARFLALRRLRLALQLDPVAAAEGMAGTPSADAG